MNRVDNWEPHDYQYGRANNIDNYSRVLDYFKKVLLHLEGRYLLYIRILMTIWVVQIAIKFSHNR